VVKLVGIGGGTGLSVLLRGIKDIAESEGPKLKTGIEVSAIVTVSDNGGSTGHLRDHFGIPAVGDLRKCLIALSEGDQLTAELFRHRFSGGNGLNGHSLGNLIVTALFQMSGSLVEAIQLAKTVLGSMGQVLPVTEAPVTLCAELRSGEIIRGECQISNAGQRIRRIWLEPESPPPARGVLQTISSADALIFGPGSLYTSIVPNLLVNKVVEAVRHAPGLKIFVCNLMTQPGETDGFTASAHLNVLQSHLGAGVLDVCLLNSRRIYQPLEHSYSESNAEPVKWNEEEIARMGVVPILSDLLSEDRTKIRHDSTKLARLVLSLTRGIQRARDILSWRETLAA